MPLILPSWLWRRSETAAPQTSNPEARSGGKAPAIVRGHELQLRVMGATVQAMRTPLSLVAGYLEWLREAPPAGPGELRSAVEIMEKHSQKMAGILDALESLRHLLQDREGLSSASVDLKSCLADALERLEPAIHHQGLQVRQLWQTEGAMEVRGDGRSWDLICGQVLEWVLAARSNSPLLRVVGARTEVGLTLEFGFDQPCCESPKSEDSREDGHSLVHLIFAEAALGAFGGRLQACQGPAGLRSVRISI